MLLKIELKYCLTDPILYWEISQFLIINLLGLIKVLNSQKIYTINNKKQKEVKRQLENTAKNTIKRN